jgi:hypothetical protein
VLIPIISLSVLLILLPAYLIYSLWTAREASKYDWFLKVLVNAAYLVLVFLIGRWDWFSIYLRYLFFVLFNMAAIMSFRYVQRLPAFVGEGRERWLKKPMVALELALAIAAFIYILSGHRYSEEAIELEFPLEDGIYYIAQGVVISFSTVTVQTRHSIMPWILWHLISGGLERRGFIHVTWIVTPSLMQPFTALVMEQFR